MVFLFHALEHSGFTEEDAFISFQYATNFVNGKGLVFNEGERVEGYTNFLWTLILSASFPLGWNIVIWAKYTGVLAALATVALLCVNKFGIDKRYFWVGASAAAFVAVDPGTAIWSAGGLETAFFTMLVTAGCLTALSRPRSMKTAAISGSLLGLASLTRPEGVLFVMTTVAAVIFHSRETKRNFRYGLLLLSVSCSIILPHLVWRSAYYGYLLPNTFYAKVGFNYSLLSRGLKYINNWMQNLLYIPPACILWGLLFSRTNWKLKSVSFISLVYLIAVAFLGGDWMRTYRFIVPVIPLTALSINGTVFDLFHRKNKNKSMKVIAVAVFCILFAAQINNAKHWLKESEKFDLNKYWTNHLTLLGLWLKHNAPPEASLATGDLGRVTYYSNLYIHDPLGIITPYIAHSNQEKLGKGAPGHEKRDWEYILSKQPSFIFGSDRLVRFNKSEKTDNAQNDRNKWRFRTIGGINLEHINGFTQNYERITVKLPVISWHIMAHENILPKILPKTMPKKKSVTKKLPPLKEHKPQQKPVIPLFQPPQIKNHIQE